MKRHLRWLVSWPAALTLLVLAAVVSWYFLPSIYIAVLPLFQDKEDADLLYRRLLACGPRSIPAIISTIRSDGTWDTDYSDLPLVLEKFGEPAHKALLNAAGDESEVNARAYLCDALVRGFDDYSRIGFWVDDALSGRCSRYSMLHLKTLLYQRWPGAPCLLDDSDSKINPDFPVWWKQQQGK